VRGVHETVCWQLTSMPRSCWNTLAKVLVLQTWGGPLGAGNELYHIASGYQPTMAI